MEILRSRLLSIAGLPCWGLEFGFGGSLTFNFGDPYLRTSNGNLKSPDRIRQKKYITVSGEFYFWISDGYWQLIKHGNELINRESEPRDVYRNLREIDSEPIVSFCADFEKGVTELDFGNGNSLVVKRYEDFEDTHALWHIFYQDTVLSQMANGTLEREKVSSGESNVIPGQYFQIALID